jgi:hypothetical protein
MRLPTARSRAATVLALAVAGSVVLTATPAAAAPNNASSLTPPAARAPVRAARALL